MDKEYNVFANDQEHTDQPKSINDTPLMETVDSNITPDSSYVYSKKLKRANVSLTHELNECKSALAELNDIRNRCTNALHNKEIELEKYKKYKDLKGRVRTPNFANPKYLKKAQSKKPYMYKVPFDKDDLEKRMDNRWKQPITQEIIVLVKNLLIPLAKNTKETAYAFESSLKKEMFEDLKYVQSLEKEVDGLQSDKNEFSNEYDLLLQECLTNNIMCDALSSMTDIDEYYEITCKYLEKIKECERFEIELSKQTKNVSKEVYIEVLRSFTKLEKHSTSLELSLQQDGIVRPKTYEELSDKEKLQADCDLKATNIILQGLPPDVYSLFNHHKVFKEVCDILKLLMQGTSLSKQERERKLYDEFDKFTYVKGESLLPPEWSKFVTNVKLARDFHTLNYDQLYVYLK
nr:hypothetical protein [Tanacetum cinerariifolium]